ncbi:Alpha/Beta hydrolase protein [Powellomyces hirtus]|nr:Alpha/Beta hydrolase protein [Powellomyces hirtus]
MESRTYEYKKGSDGQELLADVYWNNAGSKESNMSKPAAVVFHSGGFVVGSKDMIPRLPIEKLASLGFVVVIPNYRLCPQISVHDGPVTDAKDALAWIRSGLNKVLESEGISVNPDRVAAIGYSAGGALAMMLGTVEKPVKAILDCYGVKLLSDPSWSVPNPGFLTRPAPDEQYTQSVFSGPQVSSTEVVFGSTAPPTARAAWLTLKNQRGQWLQEVVKDGDYARVDPIAAAAIEPKKFPPTLIIHGDADTFVPYHLSVRGEEKLKALGIDVTLLSVEGKNHLFDVALTEDDPLFKDTILKGLEFLAKKV